MRRRVFAYAAILVMMSTLFWPNVAAEAATVSVSGNFVAEPDDALTYNDLINWANVSDMPKTNYNRTWDPLFAAYPDMEGITVTPVVPPAVIRYTASTLQAVQRLRFTPNEIMDGVSVSWWRSPIGAIPTSATINLKVYRLDANSMNISGIGASGPTFNSPAYELVWNWTGTPSASDQSFLLRQFRVPLVPDMANATWTNLSSTIVDTYVAAPFDSTNYEGQDNMRVIQDAMRALVKWNTSSIPSGHMVTSANLSLWEFDSAEFGYAIGTYRALSAWNNTTVNWNTQPTFSQSYTDAQNSLVSVGSGGNPEGRIAWNVTDAADADHTSGVPKGVVVKYVEEPHAGLDDAGYFHTIEVTDPAKRPTLWVQHAPTLTDYNFTYLRVFAPLFPNKDYVAYWSVSGAGTQPYHLYYSPNDIGNDESFNSWLRANSGSTTFIPVDLDQSIVMTRGMTNGIAGLGLSCGAYDVTTCSADSTVEYAHAVNATVANGPSYTYLNLVMPVITKNSTSGLDADLDVLVYYGSSFYPFNPSTSGRRAIYWNDTLSHSIESWNLSAVIAAGSHVYLAVFKWTIHNNESWFYLQSTNEDEWTNVTMTIGGGALRTQYAHYATFSSVTVNSFFYENTNRTIVVVPIEEPSSPLEIVKAWQQWEAQLRAKEAANARCALAMTMASLGVVQGASGNLVGAIGSTLTGFVLDSDCAIQGVLNGFTWIAESIYNLLKPILEPIAQFLYAVGSWIWQALQFVVAFLEWLAFWVAKFLNLFLIVAVFAIAYLSPTYVGRGIYAFVRSGYDANEAREVMREGWERVWSVIQLLISFVLIVVAAVSAVIPL